MTTWKKKIPMSKSILPYIRTFRGGEEKGHFLIILPLHFEMCKFEIELIDYFQSRVVSDSGVGIWPAFSDLEIGIATIV